MERTKKAQEEAFQRDIETLKEKNDKNGEWMNRLRVRRIRVNTIRWRNRRYRRGSDRLRKGLSVMMRSELKESGSISSSLDPTPSVS